MLSRQHEFKRSYRLGPVNSKSFVDKFLLQIKWNSN